MSKVPKSELLSRMERFLHKLDEAYAEWELCAIVGGINMFYLTGTMCDGLLLIRRGEGVTLWVRKSYDRAVIESELDDIRPMKSFRDVAVAISVLPDTLYIDTSNATLEWFGLLKKHMPFENVISVDNQLLFTRAVKSEYEIEIMKHTGIMTDRFYREELPVMLHEGISEVEIGAQLYALFY